jgi:hypothetical protein
MHRVHQPAINLLARDTEHRDFWPGFVLALIGLVLLAAGFSHLTDLETLDQNNAWERQLVKAFSTGGLQYATPAAPPRPGDLTDPAIPRPPGVSLAKPSALDRGSRVRINTEARTPCPT